MLTEAVRGYAEIPAVAASTGLSPVSSRYLQASLTSRFRGTEKAEYVC
jgi:hypothetical protein